MKYNIELELSDNIVEELKDCNIELSFLQPFEYLSIPLKEEGRYNISVSENSNGYKIDTKIVIKI